MWSMLIALVLSLHWGSSTILAKGAKDVSTSIQVEISFGDPETTSISTSIEVQISFPTPSTTSSLSDPAGHGITTIVEVTPKETDNEGNKGATSSSGPSSSALTIQQPSPTSKSTSFEVNISTGSETDTSSSTNGISIVLTATVAATCVTGNPVVKDGYSIYYSPIGSGTPTSTTGSSGEAKSGAIRKAALGFMSFIPFGFSFSLFAVVAADPIPHPANQEPENAAVDVSFINTVIVSRDTATATVDQWNDFVSTHLIHKEAYDNGADKMGLVAKKCQDSCDMDPSAKCVAFAIYFGDDPPKSVCEEFDALIPEDVMNEAQEGIMGFNKLCRAEN